MHTLQMHFFFPSDAMKGKDVTAHSFPGCIPHCSVEKCFVSSGFISNRQDPSHWAVTYNHKILRDWWRGGGAPFWVFMLGVVCVDFLNEQLEKYHVPFPSSPKLTFYKEMTIRLIEHNFSFINWCQLLPITMFSIIHSENSSETIFFLLIFPVIAMRVIRL